MIKPIKPPLQREVIAKAIGGIYIVGRHVVACQYLSQQVDSSLCNGAINYNLTIILIYAILISSAKTDEKMNTRSHSEHGR